MLKKSINMKNDTISLIIIFIIIVVMVLSVALYKSYHENLARLETNLSELKELLINYQSSNPISISQAIHSLNLKGNKGKLIHIYVNGYVTI